MKRSEAREQAFALTFERTINRESVSRIIDAAGLSKDMIVDDFAERLAEGAEQHEAEIDAQIEKNPGLEDEPPVKGFPVPIAPGDLRDFV